MILLFVLSINSQNQNVNLPVIQQTSTLESSANVLVESKCTLGTSGEVIDKLNKLITHYENLCSISEKKEVTDFVNLSKILGKLEAEGGTNTNDFAALMALSPQYSFLDSVKNPKDLKFDELFMKIEDALNTYGHNAGLPTYYIDNIWRLIKYVRYLEILKMYTDAKVCIQDKEIKIVVDIRSDPTEHNSKCQSHISNEFKIDPLDFEENGIAIAFWAIEDATIVKNHPEIAIAQGYINNNKLFDFSYLRRNEPGQIINRFIINGETKEIVTNVKCTEYVFVLMAFERDCDHYKVSIAIRFPRENIRTFFQVNANANVIENLKINYLKPPIRTNPKIYKDFVYSEEAENKIVADTIGDILTELSLINISCSTQPNCHYFSTQVDKCEQCNPGTYLSNGKCVEKCPGSSYPAEGECNPCQDKCSACSTDKDCSECQLPYHLLKTSGNKMTCVPECLVGMIVDKNNECVACTDNCSICKSTKECSECKQPGFYLHNGNCVSDCPYGTFKENIPKNECKPCAVGCDKCESLIKCNECKDTYFLKDNACVKNCGDEYFANVNTEKCEPCIDRCKTCADSNTCEKCADGYHLDKETKTCIKVCQPTQTEFKDVCIWCGDRERCDECDPNNVQICKKCLAPWLLLDGNCVDKCGDGYYSNDNGECKPCNTNCKTCNKDICFLCNDNHYLYQYRDCPSNCPDGYIISGRTCVNCKNDCKKCTETNQEICTECYLPKVLKEGKCEDKCGANYWQKDKECFKCGEGCSDCKDNFSCNKCDDGYFMKDNVCVKDCGDGMVPVNGECKKCKVQDCLTCPPTDLNHCNECSCDKVLYGNACYDKCPAETYQVNNSKCENCPKDCLVCKDGQTCEKCKNPAVLQGTECKSNCNDGFKEIDGVCKNCESELCKKCDHTLKSCTECYTNHFLYDKTCVSPCPDGTFEDGNKCSPCQKPCEKCSGSSDKCTVCMEGFAMDKDGTCTDNCPSGTVMLSQTRKCADCLDKGCDKCDQNDTANCFKCLPPKVHFNGDCLENCPTGYFNSNGDCLPCINGCKTCSSTTCCNVCNEGYLLKEKHCVKDCGEGWIETDEQCSQCKGNCIKCTKEDLNRCTKCPDGLLLLDGKCVNECPPKFWSDNISCQPCYVSDCTKCSSKGNTCETCALPLVLNDNQCVPSCPDGKAKVFDKCEKCIVPNCKTCPTTSTGSCTECFPPSVLVDQFTCGTSCPNGYYADKDTRICKQCIDPCNECDNSVTCNKCNPGFYLEDGKCVENCKDGSRKVNDKCTPCDTQFCKQCTQKECLICKEPHKLLNNECVDSCPSDGYYLDSNNDLNSPTCKPCNTFCNKCDNGITCNKCEPPKVLNYDSKCVDNCKDGDIEISGKCTTCTAGTECKKCSSSDLSKCIDCKDKFYLLHNQCVTDCGEGYFVENQHCTNCIDNCSICHRDKTCDKCKANYYLLDGVCNEQCPPGTYPIDGKCVNCNDPNCDECTSDKCKRCEDKYYLENGKCTTVCSPGYFLFNLVECKKCEDHCVTCLYADKCNICEKGYYLKNGHCVSDCGTGYVAGETECKQCDIGCDICSENNPKKCEKCTQPKLLHVEKCVDVCLNGFFADGNRCSPCIDNCNLCTNNQSCDQCKENFLYQANLNKCVTECLDGYRPDKSLCAPCQVNDCKKCDSNSEKCDECNSDKFKLDDMCIPQCPKVGYYVDVETKECKTCPAECVQCINGKDCKKCKEGFYLKDDVCVNHCDEGEIIVDGKCTKCQTQDCSVCPPTDLSECIKCKGTEVLSVSVINGKTTYKCSDKCDEGFYPKDGKCQSCIEKCSKCTDSKTCDKCQDGFLLENGICVQVCNKGFVERQNKCLPCNDKSCLICDNMTLLECKKCNLPLKLKDGKCVLYCESGYFEVIVDDMITCNPCVDHCNSCSNLKTCNVCDPGFYLKDGLCVPDCGENSVIVDNAKCEPCSQKECKKCSTTLDKCIECFKPNFLTMEQTCVPNCGDKKFERHTPSPACIPCNDSNCLVCEPDNVCKKCISPFVVSNNKCVQECSPGYYVDQNNTCQNCDDNKCVYCSAEHPEDCNECGKGFFLNNKKCVEKCPDGTFPDENNECQACEARCKNCKNAHSCNVCKPPFFHDQNNHCTDSCDKGYVKVEDQCQPCQEKDCVICDSKETKTCLECDPKLFLYKGECVDNCPSKSISVGRNCVDCEKDCSKCIDVNTCVECVAPSIEDNGDCVSQCKTGYSNVNGHCQPCDDRDNCNKCKNDLKTCEECRSPLFIADGKCIENCGNGLFYDAKLLKCVPCTKDCSICNNPETCQKCNSSLFINYTDDKCVNECPDKFRPSYIDQKCIPCENNNCKKCDLSNPKSCKECPVGTFLIQNNINEADCVPFCPLGFYPSNGKCQPCDPKCHECTDDKTCNICKKPYYLLNNECKSDCPKGYTLRNDICYKCSDPKCEVCSNVDFNECEKCEQRILFKSRCIDKCPDGYRYDPINNTCVKCAEHCIKCDEKNCNNCEDKFYFMENSTNCVDCLKPNLIINGICTTCKVSGCQECVESQSNQCKTCDAKLILFEGNCITTCPDGYTKDGNTCKKCSEGCVKCTDEQNCIICSPDLVKIDGKCEQKCPEGFINNSGVCEPCKKSDCLKCDSNISTCDKCKEKFILFNGSCLEYCQESYYLLIDKCEKCPDSCKNCDANGCHQCYDPNKIKEKECVPNCGDKYFDKGTRCEPCTDVNCLECGPETECKKCNNQSYLLPSLNKCTVICPDGTYPDDNTRECKPCDTGCTKCTSISCEECKPGFFSYLGKCVPKCPDQFTNEKGSCVPCVDRNCLECIPENPDKCQTCKKGFPNYQEHCLPNCPSKTFKIDDKCIDCNPKCASCQNANSCNSCVPPLILNYNQCENNCPNGKVAIDGKCVSCADEHCKTCSNDVTNCLDCFDPFKLYEGTCQNECPKGYFNEGGICKKCTIGCDTCKNQKTCQECRPGFFFENGSCVTECPENSFGDCSDHKCKKCDSSCDNCVGASSNDCVNCSANFFKDIDSCVIDRSCRVGTYANTALMECSPCRIPLCAQCSDASTCVRCVSGMHVQDNKCVLSRENAAIIPTNEVISSTSILNTSIDKVKGIGVSSSDVTFTFWARLLASSQPNGDNVIFSIENFPGYNYSLLIDNTTGNCKFSISLKTNFVQSIDTVPCQFDSRYEWSFFYITISHSTQSKDFDIGIHVLYNNQWDDTTAKLLNKFNVADILVKTAEFNFGSSSDNQIMVPVQIFNFEIMNYIPTEKELLPLIQKAPRSCDYFCTKCEQTCQSCVEGIVPVDGYCQANGAYLINGLQLINSRKEKLVKDMFSTNFASNKWAFTTWFYLENPNFNKKISIVEFDYILPGKNYNNLYVIYEYNNFIVNGNSFNIKLNGNTWYYLMVGVTRKHIQFTLLDIQGNKVTKDIPYQKEIEFLWMDYKVTLASSGWVGSVFNPFLYINNIPNEKQIDASIRALKCPNNCDVCTRDMTCMKCSDNFLKKDDGSCVENSLNNVISLLSRVDLWDKNTYFIDLSKEVTNNPFSISLWLRKKTHSGVPTNNSHNLVSWKTTDNLIIPSIRETLMNDSQSEFSFNWVTNSVSYKHTFDHEIYDYYHVVIVVDPQAKTLKYNVNGENPINKVNSFSNSVSQLILGDTNGEDVNMEISKVELYTVALSDSQIETIRNKKPIDCKSGCKECDLTNGQCITCHNNSAPNCSILLVGFSNSYIYAGLSPYSQIIAKENYTNNLKNQGFSSGVNSLKYSMVSHVRFYQLNSKEGERQRLISVGNSDITDSPWGREIIALDLVVIKGTYTFEWITNSSGKLKNVGVLDLSLKPMNWYSVYGSIDVLLKKFSYLIVDRSNEKLYSSTSDLPEFPEKLQEYSAINLFGINDVIGTTYKMPRAEVQHSFFSINPEEDTSTFKKYRDVFSIASDPVCEGNCSLCSYNTKMQVTCITCVTGFILKNGVCESTPKYGYGILSNSLVTTKTIYDLSVINLTSVLPYSISFFFRTNYVNVSNVEIISGPFSLIFNTSQNGNALLTLQDNSISIPFYVADINKWTNVVISINEDKMCLSVSHEINPANITTLCGATLKNTSPSLTVDTFNYQFQFYGITVVNTSIQTSVIDWPQLDCSKDCLTCINNTCTNCVFGSDSTGNCLTKTEYLDNKDLDNKRWFSLSDLLGDKTKLRSKAYTVEFIFKYSGINSIGKLEVDNTSFFNLFYYNNGTYELRYDHFDTKLQSTIITYPNNNFNNLENYVALAFDNNQLNYLFFNSKSNYVQGSINLHTEDFLNGGVNLIFNTSSVRNIRFNFEKALDINTIKLSVMSQFKLIQDSCTKGNYLQCNECETGLVNVSGICIPESGKPHISLTNDIIPITRKNTENSLLKYSFISSSINSFTFSFWWRLNGLINVDQPIVMVSLVDTQLLQMFFNKDNSLELSFSWAQQVSIKEIISNLLTDDEIYSWTHITIKTNNRNNSLIIVIYISKTDRTIEREIKSITTVFKDVPTSGKTLSINFGDSSRGNVSFEISRVLFVENSELSGEQVKSLRLGKPISCDSPCRNQCTLGVCSPSDRLKSSINIGDVYLKDTLKLFDTLKGIALFRPLLDNKYQQTIENYDISFELDINSFLSSKYTVNKDTILAINNDNRIEYDDLKMDSILPNGLNRLSSLSINNVNGKLILNYGYIPWKSTISSYELPLGMALNEIHTLYISLSFNSRDQSIRIAVIADSLLTMMTINNVLIRPISYLDLVYNHPSLSKLNLNLLPTDILSDIKANANDIIPSSTTSNVCTTIDKNCMRCVNADFNIATSCIQCNDGYFFYNNSCNPMMFDPK